MQSRLRRTDVCPATDTCGELEAGFCPSDFDGPFLDSFNLETFLLLAPILLLAVVTACVFSGSYARTCFFLTEVLSVTYFEDLATGLRDLSSACVFSRSAKKACFLSSEAPTVTLLCALEKEELLKFMRFSAGNRGDRAESLE